MRKNISNSLKGSLTVITVCVLTALALTSCNFLERQPWDSVDTTNGFQTEADAEAAVNACYQPLQWAKLYNMRIWTLDIIANESVVGAGGGSDGLETVEMANFIATADNFAALDLWRGPSPGILRCNFVLKEVPSMQIENDLKNRMLGEAHFLRAHYYFILVRLFGGVPMPTEPLTSDSNLKMPRASVDEVYALIISDLQEAIARLPQRSAYGTKNVGRASKEAAMVELARVYLTYQPDVAKYNEVVRICEEITSMGYQLAADYADNFNPAKQNGVESIFEIQYYGKTNHDFWPTRTRLRGSVRSKGRVTQVWRPVATAGTSLHLSSPVSTNPVISDATRPSSMPDVRHLTAIPIQAVTPRQAIMSASSCSPKRSRRTTTPVTRTG